MRSNGKWRSSEDLHLIPHCGTDRLAGDAGTLVRLKLQKENEVVVAEGLISLRFDPCGLPAAILQPLRGEWHLHPQRIDFKSIASS